MQLLKESAAGIVKSTYTRASPQPLASLPGNGITGDKFGAGPCPGGAEAADDMGDDHLDDAERPSRPDFSTSFRMTAARPRYRRLPQAVDERYIGMYKTRFITEMNEALGPYMQFKYRMPESCRATSCAGVVKSARRGERHLRYWQLRRALKFMKMGWARMPSNLLPRSRMPAARRRKTCGLLDKKEVDGYLHRRIHERYRR